ncbi:hypothetical protein OZX72_07495 [Bifidobacterium sp. ESL0769]|uniref:hypothetical protein n=1 Tax=Bifidobacterium sp. ESL0769 TaxID=2983229 RepID=UPI0023F6DE7F|nr:hypothetical protein [Bifidobacterium sp. ESL0769]WEV67080.1 hypothetical protein OZX72_07495 [Bifidobacterium sp. ESL0769]
MSINIGQLWDQAKDEAGKLKDDAENEFNSLLKSAEKTMIADVIAPFHTELSKAGEQNRNNQKQQCLATDKQAWNDYASKFDTSAKGHWVDTARKSINDHADKLDGI